MGLGVCCVLPGSRTLTRTATMDQGETVAVSDDTNIAPDVSAYGDTAFIRLFIKYA